jgi:DNA-binding NarL/FixJ family response regulator
MTEKSGVKRVLLVDDHPIVRQGLAQMIDQEADLQVCGQAQGAVEAMEAIGREAPDVAVVDLSLPDGNGIDLVKQIRERWPGLAVLVLSMHDESLHAERALRAGAKGYIMKQEATETVLTAIRRVLHGDTYVSERMAERMLAKLVQGKAASPGGSPLERLSDREFQIFEMIGRGEVPREIAKQLGLSVKTVEAHRERIKEKLDLKSGAELIRLAMSYSLQGKG